VQLFDHDKDGILSLKETQKLLRCLGFRANEDQVGMEGIEVKVGVTRKTFLFAFFGKFAEANFYFIFAFKLLRFTRYLTELSVHLITPDSLAPPFQSVFHNKNQKKLHTFGLKAVSHEKREMPKLV
jgi:hypothetical protein